ncbi:MAG: LCP family protein [Spirochaetaceae bacterium]|jgi:anionic cell wall polymer biosynthesis LytR-Cps2A-Psr (LCP) family protein|nr:LCP family protein [Spirochaetaceae bacterium]
MRRINMSIILLGAILIVSGLVVYFIVDTLRRDPIDEALSGNRVIKTLFIIEDKPKEDGTIQPLGTYILLFYPQTRRAAVFDIPGNIGTMVSNRYNRLDATYVSGKIANYERVIETLVDIDIDFYLVFSLENLRKTVDLLEGVELFIPNSVARDAIFFPSGLTRLDGDKAIQYITYSFDDESFEQINFRRQRFFISFVQRLGAQSEALQNKQLGRAFLHYVSTSMNADTMQRLLSELSFIDSGRIAVQSVNGNSRIVSGETLIFPYYDGSLIKEIIRETQGNLTRAGDGASGGKVYTVEVLNGSGVTGLANRSAELLRSFGYDVLSIGNADNMNYTVTVIHDRSGDIGAAENFGSVIRCSNIIEEDAPANKENTEQSLENYDYKADFTLILGKDFNGRYVN